MLDDRQIEQRLDAIARHTRTKADPAAIRRRGSATSSPGWYRNRAMPCRKCCSGGWTGMPAAMCRRIG